MIGHSRCLKGEFVQIALYAVVDSPKLSWGITKNVLLDYVRLPFFLSRSESSTAGIR